MKHPTHSMLAVAGTVLCYMADGAPAMGATDSNPADAQRLLRQWSRKDEEIVEKTVRFRTVGDVTCTGCVESLAGTVSEVIAETAVSRLTERGATRADDRISEAGMEDRKREGYF